MMQEAEYSLAAKAQLMELEGGKEKESDENKPMIELQASREVIHSQIKKSFEKLIVLRGNKQTETRQHSEILLLPIYNKNECVAYNLQFHEKQFQELAIELPSYFAYLNLSDCAILAGGQNIKKVQNIDLFLEIRYKQRVPTHLPSLMSAKRRMGICVEGEEERYIFIIGGHDGDNQITAV